MRSNRRLCLRSNSNLSRFLLVKAISIPEKKAEKSNVKRINSRECNIARLLFKWSGLQRGRYGFQLTGFEFGTFRL